MCSRRSVSLWSRLPANQSSISSGVSRPSSEFRVPLTLVIAIIKAESNFYRDAVSSKKARGLMQLLPETAPRFRVKDFYDPAQNIRGRMAYLRWLLTYFEGDVTLVATPPTTPASVQWKNTAASRPYAETREYVRRILADVGSTEKPFDASAAGSSPHVPRVRERQRTN